MPPSPLGTIHFVSRLHTGKALFTLPRTEAHPLRTAHNISSMYQDIQRGAATQIDAICGAVVRVGEEAGVATPVNRVTWKLVRAGEVALTTSDF